MKQFLHISLLTYCKQVGIYWSFTLSFLCSPIASKDAQAGIVFHSVDDGRFLRHLHLYLGKSQNSPGLHRANVISWSLTNSAVWEGISPSSIVVFGNLPAKQISKFRSQQESKSAETLQRLLGENKETQNTPSPHEVCHTSPVDGVVVAAKKIDMSWCLQCFATWTKAETFVGYACIDMYCEVDISCIQ